MSAIVDSFPEWGLDLFLVGLAFSLSWLAARSVTPHLILAARKYGIVDKPDGKLKKHDDAVAYLGGLAVALGVVIALGVTYRFGQTLLGILLAALIVLVLGLVDDLAALSPRVKLAGQLLATLVLIKAGVYIKLVFLPVWVAIPLTMLWMVAATNAFNLIDIMDGLSSGVGAVAALFFAGIAFAAGLTDTAFLGAALAGGLIGFRRFNVQPAQIYMGDTGSMFTGFCLGALAIVNHYTGLHRVGVVAPLLILGVPLFDMLFVMYIRRRRGLPMMLGSPDHVALRLRKWRMSTRETVRANILMAILLGTFGVATMTLPMQGALIALAIVAMGILALALWLRRIDMSL